MTRKTANPHGIFVLMQDILVMDDKYLPIAKDIRLNFYEIRISAERMARQCHVEKEEISLLNIYEMINATKKLSSEEIQMLIQLENDLEIENCVGVPSVVNEVNKKIASGDRIVFISDMYLDKEIICNILAKANVNIDNTSIYVSSEYNATKKTGRLYEIVRQNEKVEYEDWIHIGDNIQSDIEVASLLGINTVLFDRCRLNDMEENLLRGYERNKNIQLAIGISKNARLSVDLDEIQEIGITLGGIILVPYVQWILEDSLERKKDTLLFVARDGYVLKEIADIIIEKWKCPIKTKYIYGSRKAWRMPSKILTGMNLDEERESLYIDKFTKLEEIADVFNITCEDLLKYISLDDEVKKRRLTNSEVYNIFEVLSKNIDFKEYLVQKNEVNLELLKKYMTQEVDFSEKNAFVELAGTGYTQKCITSILKSISDQDVSTYYFGMYQAYPSEEFIVFFPDTIIGGMIELLCRALHGQTLGYDEYDGKMVPLLDGIEGKELEEYGYGRYIEGIRQFARKYVEMYDELEDFMGDRMIVRRAWQYYTNWNNKRYADFFGDMPFDALGTNCKKYAPKLDKKQLFSIFGSNRDNPMFWNYEGSSIELSLLRLEDDEKEYYNTIKNSK